MNRVLKSLIFALALASVSVLGARVLVAQPGNGGGGSGGGGGDGGGGRPGSGEGYGNNLSVPAVFAEGYGMGGLPTSVEAGTGLRPLPGEVNYPALEYLNPADAYVKDGVTYYPQQTSSHWQAAWTNGASGGESVVVNWSDNLVRQRWTTRSTIRVENIMYQKPELGMSAYTMAYLFGKGSTEMWGTTGATYDSLYRTVFSVCARLKIQKLTGPGGTVDTSVQGFDGAVYEGFGGEGSGSYSAEVNVSGNLVYGYNWMLSQWPLTTAQKAGWWRLTFSLDPTANYSIAAEEGGTPTPYSVPRNASFASLDPADVDGTAVFAPSLPDASTSVLEIEIIENRKGGKGGSAGGGE